MAPANMVELWKADRLLTELWVAGVRGKALVEKIRPLAKAWAEKKGRPVPDDRAIGMACRRYMTVTPPDRRTKKARAQKTVTAALHERANVP